MYGGVFLVEIIGDFFVFLQPYMFRNAIVCFAVLLLVCSCGRGSNEVSPVLVALLSDSVATDYAVAGDTVPDGGCVRLRTRVSVPLSKLFADINPEHLAVARRDGITPVDSPDGAWREGRGLVRIESNKYYFVDELKHSYPYLKPHAAALLAEMGRRFHDSLVARGGGEYRPKVTSVLRTPLTVGRLRRVNRNASAESAHQYATTFDISYSKFICDDASATRRTFEDLKNLLAEITADLRSEGRCVVKHERRQACFHITAIDRSNQNISTEEYEQTN